MKHARRHITVTALKSPWHLTRQNESKEKNGSVVPAKPSKSSLFERKLRNGVHKGFKRKSDKPKKKLMKTTEWGPTSRRRTLRRIGAFVKGWRGWRKRKNYMAIAFETLGG